MQFKKQRLPLFPLILILGILTALSGCGPSVEIQDVTLYGSLGPQGAAVFHMISSATGQEDSPTWLAQWNDLSHPMICMSSDDFSQIKIELEDLCSYYKSCTEPAMVHMRALFQRIEDHANMAKSLR